MKLRLQGLESGQNTRCWRQEMVSGSAQHKPEGVSRMGSAGVRYGGAVVVVMVEENVRSAEWGSRGGRCRLSGRAADRLINTRVGGTIVRI